MTDNRALRDNTSSISGYGYAIETWGYSSFNYVTFTNGKVSQIYTS
ncbi:hypothetical protein [Paenibacillus spongiae]|uniref:Uncharacterized protein n=1 Tax=Paenibacillus spongiae TaxID=2909671 RepID=A0ABY5SFW5_9BACL|nr:hypothetical protein [Paenibacillus spongiae]UVI32871.1 hypothetical protein L1F29_14005 [Paenibacillus spongiae]